MTVGAALAQATARLAARRDGARYDATLLLAATLGRTGAWLLAHGDDPIGDHDRSRFESAVARRETGEPVPYITGEAGFYGRLFHVDANVLVPRPETEGVVEAVVALVRARRAPAPRLCDVGTGSGAIAITLALELPEAEVTAIDISAAALDVAKRNARALGAFERIRFELGDGLAAAAERTYAVIAANLPYVKTSDVPAPPDPSSFEPRLALDGGTDGLELYRTLLRDARGALEPGGALVLEAGPDTVPELAVCAAATFLDAAVRIEADASGRDRLVIVVS